RGGGRVARTGVRRQPDHGRPCGVQSLCHRHPGRPRQHQGCHPGRLHSRLRRGDRRRLCVVRLSRCNGLPVDHSDSAGAPDRSVRTEGTGWVSRYFGWLLIAVLASVPFWLTDFYLLHILITTGIFTIAAMSLNLLLGYTGQLSLGHVAFFGIGAYTSAL